MQSPESPTELPVSCKLSPAPATVLLLGNYRPAVVIARTLAKRGFRIILGLQGEHHGCRYSRHVHEVWDHPALANGNSAFSVALGRFLAERRGIQFVFPVTEEFANYFAAHSDLLAKGATLVSPRPEVIATFSDKISALKLARNLSVATLPFKLVHDYSSLIASAGEIGFPLTVRPLGTTARLNQKKALILAGPGDLKEALPAWPDQHGSLLLQQFASGIRHNLYFAACNGRIIAACQSKIFRTNDPDGTGLAVVGQTVPVSRTLLGDTQSLVAATNYTGIGLAQFIVDSQTGERCFLELNPRVSGSHAVPEHAGVPLSSLAIELAANQTSNIEPAEAAQYGCLYGASDLTYVWTSGDIHGAKTAVINGEIGILGFAAWLCRALVSAIRSDCHMIWRLDDPLPAIVATFNVLPNFTKLRLWSRKLINRDRVVSRES